MRQISALRATKACRATGGVSPLIPKLRARWKETVNLTHDPLYLQEKFYGHTLKCEPPQNRS